MSLVSSTMTRRKLLEKLYICCSQGRLILIQHEDWKQGEPASLDLSKMSRTETFNVYYLTVCVWFRFICKGFERSCHPFSVAGVAPLCQHDQNLCSLIICAEVMSRWLDCCDLNMHVCRISGDILAEIIFIAVFSTGN